MDSNEAKSILEILSELMDEQFQHTEQEKKALALYNEMRQEINTGLLYAVERISYENKYAVLDSANDLADSIGLYLNYPELIGKYVIGFYAPDETQIKSIYKRYLHSAGGIFSKIINILGASGGKGGLSNTIPTILFYGEDRGKVRALNQAGKQVPLLPENYAVLEPGKKQALDLRSILISYCLSSISVPEHQAILMLPSEMNWQQAYGKAMLQAMDALVVQCSQVDDRLQTELLQSSNIKLLLAIGRCDETKKTTIMSLANSLHCEVRFVNSMSDTYGFLQTSKRNTIIQNFDNELLMESRLCGVLWYLAKQKESLKDRMAQINQDLLGNDAEIQALTKNLQKKIGDQLRELDQCADAYYVSLQKILREIHELQQFYSNTSGHGLNEHVAMFEPLMELLIAEGAFFRQYEKSNANDHMRGIEPICGQIDGGQTVARVLINDYYGRTQREEDLKAFAQYPTQSALILKKKLEMHTQLGISTKDCARIIETLGESHSPMEYRLLGQAQYESGQQAKGMDNLKKALECGDREAGDFLFTHCKEAVGLPYLADNGVSEAAFEHGKLLFSAANNSKDLGEARKYLHIAVAQGHAKALELLGDLWYNQGMEAGQNKKRTESMKTALAYYVAAQDKLKNLKKSSLEKMGIICFEQKDYLRAKPILEKVQTPQALFLLGTMSEKGLGSAASENQAMKYYEAAADKGHGQAQVEYARLCAKAEEAAKKTTITSNTSYYSSSYYCGYYSYYSGW